MSKRIVDEEITLVPYYPNYKTALVWYQDPQLCMQVDGREELYDLPRLKRMYQYLHKNGQLFYIKYKNRLCGDVCLKNDGEICIVISAPFQNRHIGRRVICEIMTLASETGLTALTAEIYDFNRQSQKMFESIGFQKSEGSLYTLTLQTKQQK